MTRVTSFRASDIVASRLHDARPGWGGPRDVRQDQQRAAILARLQNDEGLTRAAGLPWIITGDAHDVTYGAQPHGDLFVCDMLLALNGGAMADGLRVLDFGCSTGRVIRNLAALQPQIRAEGCDPRPASIELISKQVTGVEWFTSDEEPPLPGRGDDRYDLVFAVSVWSHFAEGAALAWFAEMARVVKPGGRLVFSTHGLRSVHHLQHVLNKMPTRAAEERREALAGGRLHFLPYGKGELNKSWGMAFMPESWVRRELAADWDVETFAPGLLLANQDVYVMHRKG